MSRRARGLAVVLALAATTACGKSIDAPEPTLPRPQTLPAIGTEPVAASVAARAALRARAGLDALERSQLQDALSANTEACNLDPSAVAPRLQLARTYRRAGLGSVALELLSAWKPQLDGCGPCLEGLLLFASDPEFAPLRDDETGAALVAAVSGKALPWARWATEAATALSTPLPGALESFAHPQVPFTLSRVCPDCANPERRQPEERELQGFPLLAKVASRFDSRNPLMGGIALHVPGSPSCEGRCCRWTPPSPLPQGGAVLTGMCFRPLTPEKAALTRIELVYGATREPAPSADAQP
ncbi:MAG: hypothetical protein RIT45_2854 [Pseudomonadota bacterium]|jgi:hypothetical protein